MSDMQGLSILLLMIIVAATPSVYANSIKLGQGTMLFYNGMRVGTSGQPGYETWNISISIAEFNQTTLVFQSNSTAATSTLNSSVTIEYQNGFPTYVDYLTALIYLPAECLSKSLQGDLSWMTRMQTRPSGSITAEKGQTTNVTTEAGSFRCINITLTLAGMDSGSLTLIYDVDSGILTYEQWTPNYGDIVILTLTGIAASTETHQLLPAIALAALTLAIPFTLGTRALVATIKKNKGHEKKQRQTSKTTSLSLSLIITGGMLTVVSIYLPWTQSADMLAYLPLTLPSAFNEPARFYTSISFTAISLMVHTSAVLAWVGVATYVYVRRKLALQLFTMISVTLAFISIVSFIQTGSTTSWGQPIIVAAGILALVGVALNAYVSRPKPATSALLRDQSEDAFIP